MNKKVLAAVAILAVLIAVVVFRTRSSSADRQAQSNTNAPVNAAVAQPAAVTSTGTINTDGVKEFAVTEGSYYFTPSTMKVQKGDKVKITFKDADGFHDFVIDELNLRTQRIKTGEDATLEFTADQTGTFAYYCSVGKHRANGMEGKLIVE